MTDRGYALTAMDRLDEAEDTLLGAEEILVETLGPTQFQTQRCRRLLVALYEQWDKPEEAAAWRAKCRTADPS